MQESTLTLEQNIKHLTHELGYQVVELSIAPAKAGGKKISLYIYKEGGVGLDDCSTLASSLNLELDALYPDLDIALNISTPGIDRQFKSESEYAIFLHHFIEGSKKNASQFSGKLIEVTGEGFYLDNKETFIYFNEVAKSKLKSAL